MKNYFHVIKQAVLSVLGLTEETAVEQQAPASVETAEEQVARLIADYKDEVIFAEDGTASLSAEVGVATLVEAETVAVETVVVAEPVAEVVETAVVEAEPVVAAEVVEAAPVAKPKRAPRKKKEKAEVSITITAAPEQAAPVAQTETAAPAPKKRAPRKKK